MKISIPGKILNNQNSAELKTLSCRNAATVLNALQNAQLAAILHISTSLIASFIPRQFHCYTLLHSALRARLSLALLLAGCIVIQV